jgi:hypothetical protein
MFRASQALGLAKDAIGIDLILEAGEELFTGGLSQLA